MNTQFLLPVLPDTKQLLLPESAGFYRRDAKHAVDRKAGTWSTFSIHLVTAGRGFIEVEGETYSLETGDAFLYFPMQQQRYYSDSADPWSVRWLHFYGSGLEVLLTARGFHSFPVWRIQQMEMLEQLHDSVLSEAASFSFLHLHKLSVCTYAFLTAFTEQAQPWQTDKTPRHDSRIHALLPLMQQHACDPFELDRWADEAGVTTHYFCRLFKQALGMTPVQFMTLCRMQKSKQWLLDEPEASIKQIAERAGYPNTSYFNKVFLAQEGMTPGEYKNRHQRKTN